MTMTTGIGGPPELLQAMWGPAKTWTDLLGRRLSMSVFAKTEHAELTHLREAWRARYGEKRAFETEALFIDYVYAGARLSRVRYTYGGRGLVDVEVWLRWPETFLHPQAEERGERARYG